LKKANEGFEHKGRVRTAGPDLDTLIERVTDYYHLDADDLRTSSKGRQITRARRVFCKVAVKELLLSCAELARALNISPSAVSKGAKRGQEVSDRREIEKQPLGI